MSGFPSQAAHILGGHTLATLLPQQHQEAPQTPPLSQTPLSHLSTPRLLLGTWRDVRADPGPIFIKKHGATGSCVVPRELAGGCHQADPPVASQRG